MQILTQTLSSIGNLAFLVATLAIILFIVGYVPSFFRAPSALGRTILGGKFALLLLATGSLSHYFFHDNIIVGIIRFLAILSVAIWLGYDYVILRNIQNKGRKVGFWRKWLPIDNNKK